MWFCNDLIFETKKQNYPKNISQPIEKNTHWYSPQKKGIPIGMPFHI